MPVASCRVALIVQANAPRDALVGWAGDALKVKIHAPALDGRANAALCDFMAEQLRLPRRSVTLERGLKSRYKVIRVCGLELDSVRDRLTL